MTEPGWVISNAGPLINLAKLNQLSLLPQLFGEVIVPQQVFDEVVTEGLRRHHPDARSVAAFLSRMGWQPTPLPNSETWNSLERYRIDMGERAAIALALDLGNSLLLLDNDMARSVARDLGFLVTGTLGILVQGYQSSVTSRPQFELTLREIEAREDIWLSRALIQQIRARYL